MLIKKNKKIFIYFIFFLLLGSLNNKYLNKINFPKLNEIRINGINEKNQIFLLEELDKFTMNNIFEIDQASIISIIDKVDIIENYKIFKKYPSTLEINIEETKLITNLRDTLLPKLISGELKIPDVDNLIEEAKI